MKNKAYSRLAFVTLVIGAVNLLASVLFILTMPDRTPVHFNAAMECDKLGSKWVGLIIPLVMLAFPLLVAFSAKGKNADKNVKSVSIALLVIEFLLIFVNWFVIAIMNSGADIGEKVGGDVVFAVPLVSGFAFLVLGNYTPTIRPNKTFGLRLQWTLNNDKCWYLTHRFAGKLLFAAGFIMVAAAVTMKLCGVEESAAYAAATAVPLLIATAIPSAYAYKLRDVS